MHHGLISTQLAVIDSFLAELAFGQPVNFNNTCQFDDLLSHLEATLTGAFLLVPSVDVLHVLFTLAARCHRSNWTHADLVGTHYMRQVNLDYDAAVAKSLLQQRATRVLLQYVKLLERYVEERYVEEKSGGSTQPIQVGENTPCETSLRTASPAPSKSQEPAFHLLFVHMEQAVGALVPIRRNFFSSRPAPSPPPQLMVVEVISDSEGLDSLLEIEHPRAAERMLKEFSAPALLATALSDLGTTSGLGEATALFTKMPHLLAHGTPEPESDRNMKRVKLDETLPAEQTLPKKRKSADRKKDRMYSRGERIRVFDDVVLAQAVDPDSGYDIWTLLRWCFTCAQTSTQYQAFLFNANHTNVHDIYRAYEGVFSVVFLFMEVQRKRNESEKGEKSNTLLDRALYLLGPKRDIYDRAVEYTFTGLDQTTNDTAYPCYTRERVLLKNDPTVVVSQCKGASPYVDNQHLMNLRAQIVMLLQEHEKRTLSGELSVAELVSAKLLGLRFCHVKDFFNTAAAHENRQFLSSLCSKMLSSVTGLRLELQFLHDAHEQLTRVLTVISDERLYSSISEDYSFRSFDEFWQRWQTALFLVQWLLDQAILRVGYEPAIRKHCRRGDRHRVYYYNDFLDSRADDADVQPEDLNFVLTLKERERYREYTTFSFCEIIGAAD